MDALILGGESPRHHGWVRDLAERLKPKMNEVVFLDYRHWSSDEATDIEHEVNQAAELAEGLDDYVVIAKSLGTVITSLAVSRGLLAPKHCMLMGLPLGLASRLPEVGEAFGSLPPTIFLQNANDPLGSAETVGDFLKEHRPPHYNFKTLPGSTHDYLDFGLIAELAVADPKS